MFRIKIYLYLFACLKRSLPNKKCDTAAACPRYICLVTLRIKEEKFQEEGVRKWKRL